MMAFDELWYRRGQFALIGAIVTLVTYLVLAINALGAGLVDATGGAVKRLNADLLVFRDNANLSFNQSELSAESVMAVAQVEGVEAWSALGYLSVQPSRKPEAGPAAFLGYQPGTISEPKVVRGRALAPGERGAVLADSMFLDERDVEIGDRIEVTIRLQPYEFEIVGEVDGGLFFFQAPLWGSIEDWRSMKYGDGADAPAASLVMVKGRPGVGDAIEAAVPETEVATPQEAYEAIPGVQPQRNTANAIQGFGLIIGAMVIGVFFYVLTMQKIGQIGVLKAIGASSWFIFRQLLVQVLVISVIGVAVALPLVLVTVEFFPEGLLLVTRDGVLVSMALLLATAIIGVAFSGRRIATVDPLIALGQQQ